MSKNRGGRERTSCKMQTGRLGEIGRRRRLKISRPPGHPGSSPGAGTSVRAFATLRELPTRQATEACVVPPASFCGKAEGQRRMVRPVRSGAGMTGGHIAFS